MRFKTKVLELHFYTDSAFYIRFERKELQFKAGQYLVLSIPGLNESREYSIASGENDSWLEVLVKEVPGGVFSSELKKLKPGDIEEVDGPYGFFVLNKDEIESSEFVLIATGTGISPFQSFVQTHSKLNFHLIHGIRYFEESYGKKLIPIKNKTICTSRDNKGNFVGRVNQFLNHEGIDSGKVYYLCGNSQMINDATDILEEANVPIKNIRSGVFF